MLSPRPISTRLPLVAILTAALFAGGTPARAQQSAPDRNLDLGTIEFPTSATGEAQQEFLTGVLALHSFWYPEARDHFQRAQELDPRFAMAYWGEALTHDHPLWGPLGQHDAKAGGAVLAQLDSVQNEEGLKWTDRERAYVEAVRTLYTGEGDLKARRQAYAEAMQHLAETYPEDTEAPILSALARMSVADFELEDPDDVVPVAATLEEVYVNKRKHPGVLHYLIHVYDSETFAPMGLRPARTYAQVAPAASHALHMPSHIFRQLHMWEKVVASNQEAYQASVAWQQRTNRPLRMRDFHSFSWLFDAYLALDRFDEACGLIEELDALTARAGEQGEDPGRMPHLAREFENQYRETVQEADATVSCAAVQQESDGG